MDTGERSWERSLGCKTEWGAKLPFSRITENTVKLLQKRKLTPEFVRKNIKPKVVLNGYSLQKAAIKIAKRPLLRSILVSEKEPFSDKALVYLTHAKTLEAFFRVVEGKLPSDRMSRSVPRYRPESRGNHEGGEGTERRRDVSLGGLMTERWRREREESPGWKVPRSNAIDEKKSLLKVVGVGSSRASSVTPPTYIPTPPMQSYGDGESIPDTVYSQFDHCLPSPPRSGWRTLHTRIFHLSKVSSSYLK